MKVAFDLDGTLSASQAIRDLMVKLHKAGHKTAVLTGSHTFPVDPGEKAHKKAQLENLGLKGAYDKLKVFPNPPSRYKAAWCAKHNVNLLIDNCLGTAQLMQDAPTTVVVPWKTLSP